MKMKRHAKASSKSISLEEALQKRAVHRSRRKKGSEGHDTTAREMAVEDGQLPALVHYTDVKIP